MIRQEGFDPLSDAAVAMYDVHLAHYELGPSLHAAVLAPEPREVADLEYTPLAGQAGGVRDTGKLAALRRDFHQAHPQFKDAQVLEVTWDTSPEAGLSDSGRERLTIWFEPQGGGWVQRYFIKWLDAE